MKISLVILAAALVACVFASCSSFTAEASVNPITGYAKVSIQTISKEGK